MKLMPTYGFACGEVRELADPYVDDELAVDVQIRILRHIRDCRACTAIVEGTIELKRRVRVGVKSLSVPAGLGPSVWASIGF